MPSESLEDLLSASKVKLAGPVVLDNEGDTWFAFVKVWQIGHGIYWPSTRKLTLLTNKLAAIGHNVRLIPVDGSDGEKFHIRGFVENQFGNAIHDVFQSQPLGNDWSVWVVLSDSVTSEQKDVIKSDIDGYMERFGLPKVRVKFVGGKNYPTISAIMGVLRVLAPASPERLNEVLKGKSFFVPDQVWLNRSLDKIRKAGFVVRRSDGRYFLSVKGMNSMDTSLDRNSADVRRVLAMRENFQ